MIDKRELLRRARQRRLPLAMIEKDYVLGWVLYGLRQVRGMVFKGGTALAKVYFPEAWRLSEDLDYVVRRAAWDPLLEEFSDDLEAAARESGIELRVRSTHSNPGYLQLKVQYTGLLGKNWLKIDVTPEPPIGRVLVQEGDKELGGKRYAHYRTQVSCRDCRYRKQCMGGQSKSRYRALLVSEHGRGVEEMRRKTASEAGREAMRRHWGAVERVIGQIKCVLGLRRFRLWGLAGARVEFTLACIAANIRQMARWLVGGVSVKVAEGMG